MREIKFWRAQKLCGCYRDSDLKANIYSYRDPRDAIISLYEMYKKRKNMSELTPERFLDIYDPIGQYRWEVRAWVKRKHKNVLLVRFEDLKQRPIEEFQRIFSFLDLAADVNEESIDKPVNLVDSTNRPRSTAYGWKSAPPEYEGVIRVINEKLGKEIRDLGYETL